MADARNGTCGNSRISSRTISLQFLASPRCLEMDRANVAQLPALLARNGPADAPILERAIYTLNTARRHYLYGWNGRALEDYESLNRWLNESG
jgi:hypothetical protein